jgi:hypothetical protein
VSDTAEQLAAVKREIRDFEKRLKSYGGGYRGPDGNYSHALYEAHNRLYARKQDLERARKGEVRMARQRARGKA